MGILTAKKNRLTEAHLHAVGTESIYVCAAGMDEQKEFCDIIIDGEKEKLDMDRLEKEVLSVVDTLTKENPEMGALVIECTDFPPFAWLIQRKTNFPVFDIITLTNMVSEAVVRSNYEGIMPR